LTWTYSYDAANELIGATETNSQSQTLVQASYTYDVFGHRIASSIALNGGSVTVTQYIYNGDALWATQNASGALLDAYIGGDRANQFFAQYDSSNGVLWYLNDHLGSVRALMNNSGQATDSLAGHCAELLRLLEKQDSP
jgi:YD repeat-containing protein